MEFGNKWPSQRILVDRVVRVIQPLPTQLRWARGLLALAVALAGAVGGAAVGQELLPHLLPLAAGETSTFCIVATTALFALGCAALAIRSIDRVTLASVVGQFAAAAVVVPGVALFAVLAIAGEFRPAASVVGSVAAAPIAAGLGALLGALAWAPLIAWRRLYRNPSRLGRLRFGVGLGGWLVGAGLIGLALADTPLLLDLSLATSGVGVGAMVVVAWMWADRLRWFSAVAAEQVDGWTICESAAIQVPVGLARWTPDPDRAGAPSRVLCRVIASSPGGATTLEPHLKLPAELVLG